jgi:hypothetical protein
VDRLGRLVEVPRPACLRLQRWFDASLAVDGGDTLRRGTYDKLTRFLSARIQAEAGTGDIPAAPARAIVADVFLRFVACEQGLDPALQPVRSMRWTPLRLHGCEIAYELLLVARDALDDAFSGVPDRALISQPIADLALAVRHCRTRC